MAAVPSIDVSGWLHEQLSQASPDLLREMITTFAEALMGAEADAVCGAPFGSVARTGPTPVTATGPGTGTRAGTIGLAIPKLRSSRGLHGVTRLDRVRRGGDHHAQNVRCVSHAPTAIRRRDTGGYVEHLPGTTYYVARQPIVTRDGGGRQRSAATATSGRFDHGSMSSVRATAAAWVAAVFVSAWATA